MNYNMIVFYIQHSLFLFSWYNTIKNNLNDMSVLEQLKNYTKNEVPIYSEQTFNQLLEMYPNEEDITVYRGINFETKEDYESFLKEFKQNKGYLSSVAAGFSASYNTAYDFSTTTKTYFPTLDIMLEEAKRNIQSENISGYCGVILTTSVKKGTVIDVNLSPVGVESEVLFRPNQLIKCDLLKIKSFKEQVQDKGFDINTYVKNNAGKEDGLLNYLIVNKNKSITDENCQLLLEKYLEKFSKVKKGYTDNELILARDTIVAVQKTDRLFGNESKEIKFYVPNLKHFENYELLRKNQCGFIERLANNIINYVFEIHLKYRDSVPIDYSALKNITPYLNDQNTESYTKMIAYKQKETYDNHNENFRNIYKDKTLTSAQRSKLIDNEMDDLKKFLNKLVDNLPQTMDDIKNDVKDIKTKRKNLLGKK